jgi:hypothetical protein
MAEWLTKIARSNFEHNQCFSRLWPEGACIDVDDRAAQERCRSEVQEVLSNEPVACGLAHRKQGHEVITLFTNL